MQKVKIIYIHGLGSSSQGSTAKELKKLLESYAEVIVPDLPVSPKEASKFIYELYKKEKPEVVIGSSLGAFYAMTLAGCTKILINPAMRADEDIKNTIGLGMQKFLNKRTDGKTEYLIDDSFINELKEMREIFEKYMLDTDLISETFAFFGTHDELFSHYKDFIDVYDESHAQFVDSGHRISSETLKTVIIPFVLSIIKNKER